MGIAHFTFGLLAKCSKLSQRILLVALPMRNTEYSSRLTEPERAPTIRSVPLMVLAKLLRASTRTRSTASSRHTERAMAKAVRIAVKRRLARLARARRNRYISNLCGRGGAIEFGQRQVAIKQWGQALVMADKQQAGAGVAAFGEQQLQEGFAGVVVQGRGGLVGDHQFRLADQRTGGGHPLLLADGQRVGAALQQILVLQAQVREQARGGLVDTAVALLGPLRTQFGKVARQLDVFAHRQERQQVELLEDVAGVVDAKTVAGAGREVGQLLAEQANAAPAGFLHAAQQAEQGGLAAATGALEEQGLPRFQAERGDIQQLWVPGPVEAQVGQFDQCVGHGYSELQGGCCDRRFHTLLAARADQLYLNFLRGGEGLEHLAQVEVAQGSRRGAGELVVGVDFAVVVMMLVGSRAFAVGGVVVIVVIMLDFGLVAEQRAVEFLGADHATGGLGQVEQGQGVFQLFAHGGDLGFVGGAGGQVFENHQVHRRAVQLKLQGLAIEHRVEAADPVFMGAEAGVLMIMIMLVSGMGDSQWQQGKRQSKQQTAHGEAPEHESYVM